MQKSASAPALTNGKDNGKPRSLVKRGSDQSRSSPALAAAFSLREYAITVKHIPAEKESTAKVIPIDLVIDLKGGNGRWRQKKAQQEDKRRKLEEEERKRQELLKEQEKKRKQAELAERRRKHMEEEERRWQQEREQKRQEQLEKERRRREQEEKLRQQRAEEEAERQRRMPKPCMACDATGKCQECDGKGINFSVFLVPKLVPFELKHREREHGRKHQGCDKCGGYSHNLLGDLKKGSGNCPECDGHGKIWPVIAENTSPKFRSGMTAWSEKTGELKIST